MSQLNTQRKFLEYTQKVANAIQGIQFSEENSDQADCKQNLANLANEIQHKQLLVPIVGGFSAGKSTLLNSLLGTDTLPVAITPETSVAAELIYSATDDGNIITVSDNGTKKTNQSFDDVRREAQHLDHINVFLNNPRLKELQPLILVDMPGFDSPVDQHNKAINGYMNKAAHFIFLNSVEDGTLPKSIRSQIERVSTHFNKPFSFGITKTDLRTPDDVADVKESIQDELQDFDYQEDVLLFRQGDASNLTQLVKPIDPETLFANEFLAELTDNYNAIVSNIQTKKTAYEQGIEKTEQGIQEMQKSITSLNKEMDDEINTIIQQSRNDGNADSIANLVMQDYNSKIDYFASLASNPAQITNEIRNTLTDSVTRHCKAKLQDAAAQMQERVNSVMQGMSFGCFNLPNTLNPSISIDNKLSTSDFTSIGATVSLLANVLPFTGGWGGALQKIITVAAPIIGSLAGLFMSRPVAQQAPQEDPRTQIRYQLMAQADNIRSQMTSQVEQIYREQMKKILEDKKTDIQTGFNERIQTAQKALQEQRNNRDKIQAEITTLDNALKTLTNLKQQYLQA